MEEVSNLKKCVWSGLVGLGIVAMGAYALAVKMQLFHDDADAYLKYESRS
ncbi:MAG: hypothetical protein K0Q56_1648 [Sporolactobacillus laevolacticus]|jgi:hypothetical protein|nr:hypothetical protein [Sporolactobacillus laevolacticus]